MPNYFTRQGYSRMKATIEQQRRKVDQVGLEVGQEAGISCDWHDNFGFEDAKRRLELESRALKELVGQLSDAQIIDVVEQCEVVSIGVTVNLFVDGEYKSFTIGGYGESDLDNNLISYNTPLAMGILQKEIGDLVTISVNRKLVNIEIKSIFPPSYLYCDLVANATTI